MAVVLLKGTLVIKPFSSATLELSNVPFAQGADPQASDSNGWNSLHLASQCGDIPSITLFLNKGLNVNCTAKDVRTPLMSAALRGHADAARFLLSQGEDFHVFNFNGQV